MELLLSDEHASPELGQSVGRLINAIVAVLGPELSPISSFFMRCKVKLLVTCLQNVISMPSDNDILASGLITIR